MKTVVFGCVLGAASLLACSRDLEPSAQDSMLVTEAGAPGVVVDAAALTALAKAEYDKKGLLEGKPAVAFQIDDAPATVLADGAVSAKVDEPAGPVQPTIFAFESKEGPALEVRWASPDARNLEPGTHACAAQRARIRVDQGRALETAAEAPQCTLTIVERFMEPVSPEMAGQIPFNRRIWTGSIEGTLLDGEGRAHAFRAGFYLPIRLL